MLLLGSFLSACDSDDESDVNYRPTPFELNAPFYLGDFEIPADNPMTEEGVTLGRMLFYDPILSRNETLSCASCHDQSKAFTDGKALAIGIEGRVGDRNSMSLANLLWVPRFHWDGQFQTLEQQALHPIQDDREMDLSLDEAVSRLRSHSNYPKLFTKAFGEGEIDAEKIGKALAQFQRTLISQDSKFDQYIRREYQPTQEELHGMNLFLTHPEPSIGLRGANCGDCHLSFNTGGAREALLGFHNNGLDTDEHLQEGLMAITGNPRDKGKFRAPQLRNIALTGPYMHDGRFETLEEVLDHYNEHIQMSATLDEFIREGSNQPIKPDEPIRLHLTDEEKKAVLAFLHMLTDEKFINNEDFSNPFE